MAEGCARLSAIIRCTHLKEASIPMPHSPGKHARAKQRLQAATFLVPALLTGAAVACAVASYEPLAFDDAIAAQVERADAAELVSAEATGEKQSAEPATDANYSAADYGIDLSNVKDGVYTGSAQGFKSTITVQVTIAGGKITDIQILSAGDDAQYFNRARAVISAVLTQQSTSVDTVSGATYSSKGILMAIKNALAQAKGEAPAATTPGPGSQTADKEHVSGDHAFDVPEGGLKDGVYRGSAEGYKSTITVDVTVADGKIAKVDIVSAGDDELYFGRAKGVIAAVLSKQSTSVDTVSGATYSSEGILAAIADALAKAGPADDGGKDPVDPDPDPDPDPTPKPDPDPDQPDGEVKYADGAYTAYASVANAKDPGAFDPYYVALTVTISGGKPVSITDVHGSGTGGAGDPSYGAYNAEDNEDYLLWAVEGRTFRGKVLIGIVEQLMGGVAPGSIDVVATATYSSRGIAAAYEKALAMAVAAYEEQHPSTGEDGSGGDGAGSGSGGAGAGSGGTGSGSSAGGSGATGSEGGHA